MNRSRRHQGFARVRTTTQARPPAPAERRRADDTDRRLIIDHQGNQRAPYRHAAYEVLGAVDRVDDPAARAPSGIAHLLTMHRIAWPSPAEGTADGPFGRSVGIGDRSEVRFGGDMQVERFEAARG